VKYAGVSNKQECVDLIKPILKDSAVEKFIVIGTDTAMNPVVIHIFTGAVDQCAAYPGTIMKILLLSNACSFIVAHNHPANTMTASTSDWAMVKKLKDAGKTVDIGLLDSIIVDSCYGESLSMRDSAQWYN
jgi:DNA repair protein RadC